MPFRFPGFAASHLALALALSGVGAWAQAPNTEDHTAHHPASAASAPQQATSKNAHAMTDKGAMEKMGKMDAKMKAMKELHEKLMAAQTAEERAALMPQHMKAMQEAMAMMDDTRSGGMGHKGDMGMMGGSDKPTMMEKMHKDMMSKHQMLEKRMDMMQSMMQMMMDRMQAPAAK